MASFRTSHYFLLLIAILIIKNLLVSWFILTGEVGLGPDEAQYWTWSKVLDWGYYSKPPGIAWQIWVGTHLFGDTEFGVRFPSLILTFFQNLAVFWLALTCGLRPLTAFWAAIIMAFTPIGIMGSFLAITDVGLLLFWTLACITITQSLQKNETPNYYLTGLLIAFGALFKWSIYLIWVVVIILIPILKNLSSRHILGGIFVSILGLFPSFIWNLSHDWVTFKHVLSSLTKPKESTLGPQGIFHGNFFDFLGSQAALLSPILFLMLVLGFFFKLRRRTPDVILFCGASSLLLLVVLSVMSIFQKIQGNWADYAYPTGIVFLSWCACEAWGTGKVWLQVGLALSVILSIFGMGIPYMQAHDVLSIPYKINPFRHNVGWVSLSRALEEAGYNPSENFLFGDKYQMSSILSFYGPEQHLAYFLNLRGTRLNQFSFWPGMPTQVGKTGYFVLAENSPHLERESEKQVAFYQTALSKFFGEVQFLGVKPLFLNNGIMVKGAIIFKCIDYNGQEPPNPSLY